MIKLLSSYLINIIYKSNLHIPLERNSLHASAGRLSAPNGKF